MIRKVLVLAAAVLLAAVVVGCGKSDAPPSGGGTTKGDVAKGKEVFLGTCAACHGTDAKGMPNLGKNLITKTDWMKQQNDEALLAFLKVGRTANDPLNTTKVDMPPKGGNPALTDEDLTNVVAFIRSIQK